jgi:lambda family phage portal protein
MNILEQAIRALAPGWGMRRAKARVATANYDAATLGRRASSLRAARSDADTAGQGRQRMAWYGRDLIRNTPFGARAQSVISASVVGDGIIPKVQISHPRLSPDLAKKVRDRGLQRIEEYLDTTRIDRHGRMNLYGLQWQAMKSVVSDGEVLVLIHSDTLLGNGFHLQLEVLESDHIDSGKFGAVDGGGEIREGIEYAADGQRVAYWLYPEHPGADGLARLGTGVSRRVPASRVYHIYRADRPGQNRGVSWFAPVALRLQDLSDHEDAQLLRQKIAACFAAFRIGGNSNAENIDLSEIGAGMIYDLGEAEEVKFAVPPGVEGYDEFTRSVLRSVAVGLGVSYEALTGDLSQVNFSSARMGRLEMDQNVSAWQNLMLMPQFLIPFGRAFVDAWQGLDGEEMLQAGLPADIWAHVSLTWVPPRKIIVDPAREFAALREAVRAGFASRQQVVRQLGIDPERLMEEIAQDRDEADALGLVFDSDPRADAARLGRMDPSWPEADRDQPQARVISIRRTR